MASSIANKEPTPSSTSNSRKRPHGPTPDSGQPNKKKRSSNDFGLELALDHLRVDAPKHSLYRRNADFAVSRLLGEDTMDTVFTDQIDKVLSLAEQSGSLDNQQQRNALRRQLLRATTQRILSALGRSLDHVCGFTDRNNGFIIDLGSENSEMTFRMRQPVQRNDEKGDGSVKPATDPKAVSPKAKQPNGVNGHTSGSHQKQGAGANGYTADDSEDDSEDSDDSDDSDSSSVSGGAAVASKQAPLP